MIVTAGSTAGAPSWMDSAMAVRASCWVWMSEADNSGLCRASIRPSR